jgi:hypothetical protein
MGRVKWIVVACLAGCTPYDFGKEINNFGAGVDQLSAAFTTGYTNLAEDLSFQRQLSLDDSKAKVLIASSCGVPIGTLAQSQQPCALFPSGQPAPALTDLQKMQPATVKVLKVLTDYAHALEAVTSAADRAAYDAASKRLEAAVGNLAAAANAVAPGAGVIAPVAVSVAAWVVGAALDRDRFDSLRRGVNAADGPVKTVATTLGIGLEAVRNDRLTALYETTVALVKPLGPRLNEAAYKQRLTEAETTRATLDAVRQSNPAGATASLVEAHEKLVTAVNDPEGSFASMTTAVGDFADQAKALQHALSASVKH